jgi:hypothetical protein
MMRGVVLERFFNAAEDDGSWIATIKGLTEEKFSSIISETFKWWQLVYEITDLLNQK